MPRYDPDDEPELRPGDPDTQDPEFGTVDPDDVELTARPSARAPRRAEDDDDRLVPSTNIGGAAPTPRGLDSGGDLPGPEDDLANLAEPEPPTAAEVDGLSVRREDDLFPAANREDPQP